MRVLPCAALVRRKWWDGLRLLFGSFIGTYFIFFFIFLIDASGDIDAKLPSSNCALFSFN